MKNEIMQKNIDIDNNLYIQKEYLYCISSIASVLKYNISENKLEKNFLIEMLNKITNHSNKILTIVENKR